MAHRSTRTAASAGNPKREAGQGKRRPDRLQHQFFGNYSAAVGLIFESPEYARLALPKLAPHGLGASWRIATSEPRGAVISVTSDQLQQLNVEDPRQLALF